MGNESSTANGLTGVPMPPTAWALASVWSGVWDAPRFRGPNSVHPPVLNQEALAPLLKLAASCVAALLPQMQSADSAARLPPFGASRELLVAALDGDLAGAPLASPSKDPTGFVRALVHAAFMTGDGDYVMGATEDRLDELLERHCSSQLAYATLLLTDPTSRLKAALDAATTAVQDVLSAAPPTSGDLAAAAARLALTQRLERIAEEAQGLLQGSVVPTESGDVNAGSTTEMTAEDDTPGAEPLEVESVDMSGDAGGETAAEEPFFRTQTVITPDKEMPTFRAASNDEEPPLKKTKSQIAKTLKVEKVAQSVEKRKEPVYDLSRTVSYLAKNKVPDEISALESELDAVERARKRARNFGEDLVEDLLALDGLGALSHEDRNTRKAAISGIETLLEDVDAAKARLATLHKSLESKLQESKKAMEAEDAKRAHQAEANWAEEMGEESIAAGLSSARRAKPSNMQATKKLALDPTPPSKDVWRSLRLPLCFHSSEHRDRYLITATVPGLDPHDIKLELGDDATTLTVAGLRVPSQKDLAVMRQRIAARFGDMAREAPRRLHRLQELGAEAVTNAYLELGQGEFGRFSETFHMPEDANVNDINASYRDGVLRVSVPKEAQRTLHSGVDRGYGPGSYFGGAGGHPRRHAAQQNPSVPRGGMPFFGGHDDNFWW